jgi:aryl-alcohol dehydrogenase-like predicted oxidoreductase
MKTVQLGRTGLEISALCLGSMTWGSQNTEAEGHAQIDHARAAGINFIDTAEMYPVNPVKAETVGRSEEIIGNWLAKSGQRDQIVLASKITGEGSAAVRDGAPITPAAMRAACEASLRRLQTEYIDLYQIHWPNRGSYHFRQMWGFDATRQLPTGAVIDDMIALLEMLETLRDEGKIRHFGLSNESTWGMAQWLRLADEGHGPRAAALQNEYSLLYRVHDTDMAELTVHEEVTLLAYSPLAVGILSGKYSGDATPEGSRRSIVPMLGGRATPQAFALADIIVGIARGAGLDPVSMAIAWILQRPFPVVPIIGATSVAQLEPALAAVDMVLPAEVIAALEAAHRAHSLPY